MNLPANEVFDLAFAENAFLYAQRENILGIAGLGLRQGIYSISQYISNLIYVRMIW